MKIRGSGHWAVVIGHSRLTRLLLSLWLSGVLAFSPILPALNFLQPFGALTASADTILWDGEAEDGVWSNPKNWAGDILPTDKDIALFSGEQPFPTLIDDLAIIGGIELASDFVSTITLQKSAELHIGGFGVRQAGGKLDLGPGEVTIEGSLHLAGGEFIAPESLMNISGNISVLAPEYFRHNAGTVVLTSTGEQVIFGSITFNNLSKVTKVASTLTFPSNRTLAFDGQLNLHGTPPVGSEAPDTNLLTLASSNTDEPVMIDVRGAADAAYLNVKNILNLAPQTIICTGCSHSGATGGWEFKDGGLVAGLISSSPLPAPVPTPPASPSSALANSFSEKSTADFAGNEPVQFRIEVDDEKPDSVSLTPLTGAETDTTPTPEPEPSVEPTPVPTSTPTPTPETISWLQWLFGRPAQAALEPLTVTHAEVTDPSGEPYPVEPEILNEGGTANVRVPAPDGAFQPGKYTLTVDGTVNGVAVSASQDFTWGVLAINSHQDVYLPGQTAQLAFAVLSDAGSTVCNAALELVVADPNGAKQTLSTNEGTITRSEDCNKQEADYIEPDYVANLPLPEAGAWQLHLTAITDAGSRTIEETLLVDPETPVIVTRRAATRLWPFAPSPVTLEVLFREPFSGTIAEQVPASFKISNTSPTSETLAWEGEYEAGQTATFSYRYDAPDNSPQFYLAGPLQFTGSSSWSERRAWQIAADADTVVDSTAQNGIDQYAAGVQRGLFGPYWTDASTAYIVYVEQDGGGNPDIAYSKTTSGGTSWGSPVTITADDFEAYSVWYDQNTPGDTGTKIHVAWVDGTTPQYRSLDTSNDSLGTETTVATPTGTEGRYRAGITKARGGNLYFQFSSLSATGGHDMYRSTDGGANWTDRATGYEDQADGDGYLLFPGSETDNQDVWMVYWDYSADEISLKVYDNSADSWAETSISTGMVESVGVNQGPGAHNMGGAQRASDNHLILAAWNGFDTGTDDLKVWDIASSASITAKTDVVTDVDDSAYVSVFINQQNDDMYISYIGTSAETILTAVNIYYKKSTDGGTNWGVAIQVNEDTADDARVVHAGHGVGTAGGKFMPTWFNDDLNDVYVNTTNAVTISGPDTPNRVITITNF